MEEIPLSYILQRRWLHWIRNSSLFIITVVTAEVGSEFMLSSAEEKKKQSFFSRPLHFSFLTGKSLINIEDKETMTKTCLKLMIGVS